MIPERCYIFVGAGDGDEVEERADRVEDLIERQTHEPLRDDNPVTGTVAGAHDRAILACNDASIPCAAATAATAATAAARAPAASIARLIAALASTAPLGSPGCGGDQDGGRGPQVRDPSQPSDSRSRHSCIVTNEILREVVALLPTECAGP